MTTSREMTTGPALPLILNFTLPLLLGNLLQQTYSLVDAAIVGQFLGIDALAGVGASSSVIFLILGFCNGCCADSAFRWRSASARATTPTCAATWPTPCGWPSASR